MTNLIKRILYYPELEKDLIAREKEINSLKWQIRRLKIKLKVKTEGKNKNV